MQVKLKFILINKRVYNFSKWVAYYTYNQVLKLGLSMFNNVYSRFKTKGERSTLLFW